MFVRSFLGSTEQVLVTRQRNTDKHSPSTTGEEEQLLQVTKKVQVILEIIPWQPRVGSSGMETDTFQVLQRMCRCSWGLQGQYHSTDCHCTDRMSQLLPKPHVIHGLYWGQCTGRHRSGVKKCRPDFSQTPWPTQVTLKLTVPTFSI